MLDVGMLRMFIGEDTISAMQKDLMVFIARASAAEQQLGRIEAKLNALIGLLAEAHIARIQNEAGKGSETLN